MAWPLRRVFRLAWWSLCTATLCALPITIWEFKRQGFSQHYQAWFIAGLFVFMTIPISVYEVAMHTEYYTRPKLQKHVIRILWMVPIYSLDAWFALRFLDARLYLNPIRECYEAYVIYNFFAYLMNFLEDEVGNVEEYLEKKPNHPHIWPVRLVARPWRMGQEFLWQCKKGVLNYVIIRPLMTIVAFVTQHFGLYGEGEFNLGKSYVYIATITNFSQMWSLYCLALLYMTMHKELEPIRPLSKFLCIKLVVFMTFWQGLFIDILVYTGAIRLQEQVTTYTSSDVAEGIQDLLICIEMFIAALGHAYAFPPRDYMDANIPTKGFFTNVKYMFDLRDVMIDVQGVMEEQVTVATEHGKVVVKKAATGIINAPQQLIGLFANNGRPRRARLPGEEYEEETDDRQRALLPDGTLDSAASPSQEIGPSQPVVTDSETAMLKRHYV